MWSDANNTDPSTGLPTMHDFAVVWSEDPVAWPYTPPKTSIAPTRMCYRSGDINGSPGSWSLRAISTGIYPDVACLTDNNGTRLMEFTYDDASGNLMEMEYDKSTTPPTATVTTLTSGNIISPRIEAMSQYNGNTYLPKWQIAVSVGYYNLFPIIPPATSSPQGFHVEGYNNLGSTWISSPHPHYDIKGPCVAAGIGPTFSSDLGNQQYTVSYDPYMSPLFYNRSIDASSGALDSRWWAVVDSNINPMGYPWDLSRNTAVSNCSNSGYNLLTAWYDGTYIQYKESPNAMQFRQAPTPQATGVESTGQAKSFRAFPNPVYEHAQVEEANAGQPYRLTDMSGRLLQQGSLPQSGQVDMRALGAGMYFLYLGNGTAARAIKLTKE